MSRIEVSFSKAYNLPYNFLHLCHRSNYRTPLQGLFMCGSGAHPGGGVMGAPGRNAARVVLQDIGKPFN